MNTRRSDSVPSRGGVSAQRLQRALKLTPITASVCAALGTLSGLQAQQAGPGVEQIVITGSRIVRRDLNAPSPILTVDTTAFEQSSAIALETVLNQYPQFNPGATQFTASQNQPTADTSPCTVERIVSPDPERASLLDVLTERRAARIHRVAR